MPRFTIIRLSVMLCWLLLALQPLHAQDIDQSALTAGERLLFTQATPIYLTQDTTIPIAEVPLYGIATLSQVPQEIDDQIWVRIRAEEARGWILLPADSNAYALLTDDWSAAEIARLSEVLSQSEDFTALVQRAMLYWHQADYINALEDFARAQAVQPDNAALWFYQALVQQAAGQFDLMIPSFDRAIELNATYAPYYRGRGIAYMGYLQQLELAQADFEQAISLNPNYASAYIALGNLYNDYLGQHSQAIEIYQQALALDPALDVAYTNMSIAYKYMGDLPSAYQSLDRAIEINPNDGFNYYYRGALYFEEHDSVSAFPDLNRAIELADTMRPRDLGFAYSHRGVIYIESGNSEAGRVDLETAVQLIPDNGDSWYNLGIAYANLGQIQQAINSYTQSLTYMETNTNPHWAYYNRGNLYYKSRQYELAVADFTAALAIQPAFFGALEWRGNAYDNLGDYDLALADYAAAIALDPTRPTVYYNQGITYYKLYDYENSIASYTQALELNPDYGLAYHGRALTYFYNGNFELAKADAERALEFAPGDSEIQSLLDDINAELGQ